MPNTRTVNNKALSSNIALSATDVGAVPTSRTVNSKALSSNISLTYSDVGAAASSHNHAAGNITSGTLAVARGGTGKASWTANRLVYPSASTTMNQLAFPSVAGSVLRQGTSGAPYWTSLADLKSSLGVSDWEKIATVTLNKSISANGFASFPIITAHSTDISAYLNGCEILVKVTGTVSKTSVSGDAFTYIGFDSNLASTSTKTNLGSYYGAGPHNINAELYFSLESANEGTSSIGASKGYRGYWTHNNTSHISFTYDLSTKVADSSSTGFGVWSYSCTSAISCTANVYIKNITGV